MRFLLLNVYILSVKVFTYVLNFMVIFNCTRQMFCLKVFA